MNMILVVADCLMHFHTTGEPRFDVIAVVWGFLWGNRKWDNPEAEVNKDSYIQYIPVYKTINTAQQADLKQPPTTKFSIQSHKSTQVSFIYKALHKKKFNLQDRREPFSVDDSDEDIIDRLQLKTDRGDSNNRDLDQILHYWEWYVSFYQTLDLATWTQHFPFPSHCNFIDQQASTKQK